MGALAGELDRLASWCAREGIEHEVDRAGELVVKQLVMGLPAPLRIAIPKDRPLVTFAMTMPFEVPQERALDVACALNLINAHTIIGAWLLDPEARRVFLRATVPLVHTDASLVVLASAIAATAERFAARVVAAVQG
jgi:hypothetical protein